MFQEQLGVDSEQAAHGHLVEGGELMKLMSKSGPLFLQAEM